jgi:hypothetical protein
MSNTKPDITTHAWRRAKKRVGSPDITQTFTEALKHGVHQRDLKGSFKGFIDKGARTHKASAVIYRGYVYWYNPNKSLLITVIPLAQKWHKYLKGGDA